MWPFPQVTPDWERLAPTQQQAFVFLQTALCPTQVAPDWERLTAKVEADLSS